MSDCEKCDDLQRMKDISDSFEKAKNKKKKKGQISKQLYETIGDYSKQVKDSLNDMGKHYIEMMYLYDSLKEKDLVKDELEILKILSHIENLARMESVNNNVLFQTLDILKRKISKEG